MVTHSFVGVIDAEDRFTAREVTYDGYPAGVGAGLAAVLCSSWAQRTPSLVVAELAAYRHWWSIGPELPGPTRVGTPDERSGELDLPLVTGRLGRSHRGQHEWGYLFRGQSELVVVRRGSWWETPAYPLRKWAVVPVDAVDLVDWPRLGRTGELTRRDRRT